MLVNDFTSYAVCRDPKFPDLRVIIKDLRLDLGPQASPLGYGIHNPPSKAHGWCAARQEPFNPLKDRLRTARVSGKGSPGFQCQMGHIADPVVSHRH